MAIPKITYAADVWFTPLQRKEGRRKPAGSVGLVQKLTSIQRIVAIAITWAMCLTVTDPLEMHANIRPMELLLLDPCHCATLRLTSLPPTHPLLEPICTCAHHLVKRHAAPLHMLFNTVNIQPATIETVIPAIQCPNAASTFITKIADSHDDSKQNNAEDNSNTCLHRRFRYRWNGGSGRSTVQG